MFSAAPAGKLQAAITITEQKTAHAVTGVHLTAGIRGCDDRGFETSRFPNNRLTGAKEEVCRGP